MIKKERTVGPNLGKLSNKIKRYTATWSVHGNYTGTQQKALHFILVRTDCEIFQKDIEEEFGLRSSSATNLLKSMEQNGLIERVSVDYDGRLKRIVPTEKALQYKGKVNEDLRQFELKLLNGVSDDDLEVFNRVIKIMIKNLT